MKPTEEEKKIKQAFTCVQTFGDWRSRSAVLLLVLQYSEYEVLHDKYCIHVYNGLSHV